MLSIRSCTGNVEIVSITHAGRVITSVHAEINPPNATVQIWSIAAYQTDKIGQNQLPSTKFS